MLDTYSLNLESIFAKTESKDSNYDIQIKNGEVLIVANSVEVYPNNKRNDFVYDLVQSTADNLGISILAKDSVISPIKQHLNVNYFSKVRASSALMIYNSLKETPKNVAELQKELGLSQPTIGSRLKILMDNCIVLYDKKKYFINPILAYIESNGL